MKLLIFAFSLAVAGFLAGCAGETSPDLHEAGEKLQRGVTGQGTLYEQEHPDDPFIRN